LTNLNDKGTVVFIGREEFLKGFRFQKLFSSLYSVQAL
jgi:hypothetical protein